ncbi:homeobox protein LUMINIDEPENDENS isoform X1 [Dendrobium catenatum]|uniref:homeobox protein LUMINIDEPENDENS isoform X1 n=1 Tax=Dendrobium catenatum TaxID=906689 RepID=UPI0009F39E28|nr:homeobox protein LUMINIDEPENDENS isoform X1 [Dendrobium catenatum]
MALVPVRTESSFLESEMDGSVESLGRLLDAQKKIFHSQIDQLKRLVVNQCKLTGVNPLSQEMAAGALSIKIAGKKPRDLLNPKAVKYMQSIFAIKDTIGKKETREISALCGVTVTQVRDFFSGQRSKVRKLVSLVREKAAKSDAANERCSTNPEETLLYHIDAPSSAVDVKNVGDLAEVPDSNGNLLAIQYYQNVPVSSIDSKPIQVVVPSSSSQEESIPGIYEDDKKFLENIFNLMRKEGTFAGQVKLMEWILQIHNSAVLVWFLTKGSITILATWLSQAAIEEQTTLLNVILKVLCHLPLHKALPAQMSSILQTVNKLRFYRTPDISNRAKVLLSRWSKMLVRNQAVKYPSILNSSNGVQKDIIRKQRISEILSEEFWRSKIGITDEILALKESSGNDSKSDPKQALKLLTASCNRSNRKQGQSALSIKIKERRKVRLVEQIDQKAAGRIAQVVKASPSNLSRPISADDIQKAKMRAMFMQHKYGKADASSSEIKIIVEDSKGLPAPQSKKILPPPRIMQLEQINREEKMLADVLRGDSEAPIDTISAGALQEESLEKLKRSQFQWQTPPEMKINSSWRVGEAESSKEVDVQAQRIRREKETFYSSKFDIPPDPKEPWDIEMDFDDSLTPEIPIDQPPDSDAVEDPLDPSGDDQTIPDDMPAAMVALPPMTAYGNAAEPDFELLAVLLKNPELVFALTSGQGKNLSSDERVALLDMIKHSSVSPGASLTGISSSTSQDKPKDPVPMSLPSPTPPSDVERAAGWRSAFPTVSKAQLPQSQFSCAVRHSAPTLTPTPLPTLMVLPAQAELQSAIVRTSHVLITANTVPQTVAFTSLTSQRPCPLLSQHILPSSYAEPQRLNTECSLPSKRNALSCPASAVPSPTPASFHQDTYCRNSLPTSTVSSLPSLPPPQRRSQSLMISDPSVAMIPPNPTSLSRGDASAEWSEWRDMMPESSTRRQNAKEFTLQGSPRFNASIRDIYHTHQGRSTGRVEIVGRSRDLETWSPERPPLRSSESRHGHGRSHAESRREQGWNQRHELSRQRSSEHHDQNRSSNGSRGRWRDRDRRR